MKRLVCVAFVLATACTTSSTSSPGPAATALPDVALPDLSRTEKSVQAQIGESYRLLSSKSGDADAYGALGNLLFAAEYFLSLIHI